MTCSLLVLLLSISLGGDSSSNARLPDFKDFPVRADFTGTPAAPRIQTKRARRYRTAISEGAKAGPNFANHYAIVTWGCGSDCLGLAVVDARSGQVHFHPDVLAVTKSMFQQEDTLQFTRSSRLLVVTGSISGRNHVQREGKFFYEWKRAHFRLLRAISRARRY